MLVRLRLLLLLVGCHNTPREKDSGAGGDDSGPPAGDDFCAVQSIFNDYCTVCHNPSLSYGGLDLQTDPYGAVVGVTSATYGSVLVAPGDAPGSLLYRKMTGTQTASEGEVMPTTGQLDAAWTDVVKAWIDGGAAEGCDHPDTSSETYHPPGFDAAAVHGLEAKLQTQACEDCHGADLTGGTTGVSCDSCHIEGWRTDCVYCHGGDETPDGAPPEDIDDRSTDLSYPEHTVHVERNIHPAWDCTTCHDKPTDALTPGHLFIDDATPGVAEVDFSAGLSAAGSYGGAGACSNLYCHGNGRSGATGSMTSGGSLDCGGCHADRDNPRGLSGEHDEHVQEGVQCESCHGSVVEGWTTIADPDLHVNGEREVYITEGPTWNSGTRSCSGSCHGEYHANASW